jgi:WD40 repeat protein
MAERPLKCGSCREPVLPEWDHCANCGYLLDQGLSSSAPPPQTEAGDPNVGKADIAKIRGIAGAGSKMFGGRPAATQPLMSVGSDNVVKATIDASTQIHVQAQYIQNQTVYTVAPGALDLQAQLEAQSEQVKAIGVAVQQLLQQHQLQKRELRPSDSLSIRTDKERQLVNEVVARYRSLAEKDRKTAPALLNAIGKLEVVRGDFDAAQRDFRSVAESSSHPELQAEAHFNAYYASLERGEWAEALKELIHAVQADAKRFALFPMGKYKPKRILGAGGFGVAFLCRHRELGLDVVVKSLNGDDLDRRMEEVFAEARVLYQVEHNSVIRMLDCGYTLASTKCRPFLVMTYFESETLEEAVSHGPLPVGHALLVLQRMAEGLAVAHETKIIHRDVKPANVLVREDKCGWQVKLIDFGLALSSQTMQYIATRGSSRGKSIIGGSIAGTLEYAAPEQMGRLASVPVGPYSDIYSWAKTACYILFKTTQPLPKHWKAIPDSLAKLMEECLSENPKERPATFGKILQRINDLYLHKPVAGGYGVLKPEASVLQSRSMAAPVISRRPPARTTIAPRGHLAESERLSVRPLSKGKLAKKRDSKLRKLVLWSSLAAGVLGLVLVLSLVLLVNRDTPKEGSQPTKLVPKTAPPQVAGAQRETDGQQATDGRRFWRFGGGNGYFKMLGNGTWEEIGNDWKLQGIWKEVARTPDYVELHDHQRGYKTRLGAGKAWLCGIDSNGFGPSPAGNWTTEGVSRRFTGLIECGNKPLSICFSPDGRRLACGLGVWDDGHKRFRAGEIKLWDANSGKPGITIPLQNAPVSSIAFSPDGARLASVTGNPMTLGQEGGDVNVWDASTGQEAHRMKGKHSASALGVCFSSDGRYLATGGDFTARVWDLVQGVELRAFKVDRGGVTSVCFDPRNRYVAIGSADGTTRIWDWLQNKEVFKAGGKFFVRGLSFSRDGKWLVVGARGGRIAVFNVIEKREAFGIQGDRYSVESLCLSRGGGFLASSGWEPKVKIWDMHDGKELMKLDATIAVYCVCFSPADGRVAGGRLDGKIQVWDLGLRPE